MLLMSGVQMGVLLPPFQKTVLLNDAWTALVTVAGTAIAMVAGKCCCKCCWDSVHHQSHAFPDVCLRPALFHYPSCYILIQMFAVVHVDLHALLQAHQVCIHFTLHIAACQLSCF